MDPLDDDELAVSEPRATTRLRALARTWPLALIMLVVFVVGFAIRAPFGTRIIKRELEAAATAKQQERALCRMNSWSRSGHAFGYTLFGLDADGVEFQPTRTGEYERVATLIIEWEDRSQTTIELLGHDGLTCAYHG